MHNPFKWIFSGGNYHYVTTAPCSKCGEVTELTLNDEDYALWRSEGYNHIVCPKDVK